MRNSELFALLKTLEGNEFAKFGKFVASPYFKVPAQARKLYDFIARKYDNLEHKCFDDNRAMLEYLFEKEEDRKENKARSVTAKLKGALEQFFRMEVLAEDENTQNRLLIQAFEKRGADHYFERKVKDTIKKLKKTDERSFALYREMEWLLERVFLHPETAIYNFKQDVLPELLSLIDHHYILKKLRYGCEVMHQSTYVRQDYDLLFWKEIVDWVNKKKELGDPLFEFYGSYLDLCREKKVELVDSCLKRYEAIADQLTKEDEAFVIKNLINLLIKEINKGNSFHAINALKIYKRASEKDLLLPKGRLRIVTFLNITTIGCLAAEFEWTEKFITQYQQYLDTDKREEAINYALAYLNFQSWYFK